MTAARRAVVLGGGLAGVLAAAALARHVPEVVVVERDRYPEGPEPRTGVPQARHTHVLMDGGARAVERVLPGVTGQLVAAGAHRHGMPDGVVMLSPQGWLERFPGRRYAYSCSRSLLDWTVRQQAFKNGRITVTERSEAVGLLGGPGAVTGVRLRDRDTGGEHELEAGFVVDATGRGSHAPRWLAALGLPEVEEEVVDSGQAYATRVFRAPAGAEQGFPMVNVLAAPGTGRPGCGAALLPIEEGRWMVTLGGTRGGEPPTDEEGYAHFVRHAVRHPLVADLIEAAEPLGPIRGSRSSANRRRRFDRLPSWPAGLVVTGDAATTFNPVYGHGMSVAARCAVVLDETLRRYGPVPDAAVRAQRGIGRAAQDAWVIATTQDVLYPDAVGPRPGGALRLQRRFVDRSVRVATRNPAVSAALIDSFTLARPFTTLARPSALVHTALGPRGEPLAAPPLTAWERRFLPGR